MARTGRPIQVYFPQELAAELLALSEATGRSLSDEVIAAVRRHLAHPPRVVQADPPAEEVQASGRPRRGRRPKGG